MTAPDTHRAIDAVWRIESARLIAGLARIVRDVGLAEELAQDALVADRVEQVPVGERRRRVRPAGLRAPGQEGTGLRVLGHRHVAFRARLDREERAAAIAAGEDRDEINAAAEALETLSKPFAERRMDRGIREALSGKSVNELESRVGE